MKDVRVPCCFLGSIHSTQFCRKHHMLPVNGCILTPLAQGGLPCTDPVHPSSAPQCGQEEGSLGARPSWKRMCAAYPGRTRTSRTRSRPCSQLAPSRPERRKSMCSSQAQEWQSFSWAWVFTLSNCIQSAAQCRADLGP